MIRYAGIINNDVVNGVDVCVSYWCQGCPHKCHGCHNPETWSFVDGFEADEDELIERIVELIGRNGIQRNLSILGGEPLCEENIGFIYELVHAVKERYPTIKVILWTGYDYEKYPSKELPFTPNWESRILIWEKIDIVIDGKYVQEKRDITLPLRGSSNQRVIDVQKSLQREEVVLWNSED